MPRQDELYLGCSQGFDDIEILFAGNAEDALYAFVLQRTDQEVRPFTHCSRPLIIFKPITRHS
jgi:hypothetical protein